MKAHAVLLLLTPVLLVLAACSKPPPPPPVPPVLTLMLQGGMNENPDAAGQANSVAVHLFQLTSPAHFATADVFSLLEKDKATLGEELAASETVLLAPGETVTLTRPLKPGVQLLGAVVAFRDIDRATWRVSAPVKPNGPSALALTTSGIVATLVPDKSP